MRNIIPQNMLYPPIIAHITKKVNSFWSFSIGSVRFLVEKPCFLEWDYAGFWKWNGLLPERRQF